MSLLHPGMGLIATLRTMDPSPDIPTLLTSVVTVQNVEKYHADARFEIRIPLHEEGAQRAASFLEESGVRITRYFITPYYEPVFWDDSPEDCVGGLVQPDGYVSLADPRLYRRIIPLEETFTINGRPDADAEHARYKPHLIGAGGIPIVSNEFLATLRKLGAQGETAPIIYRGFKKSSHDTIQPGFERFLVRPEYEMPHRDDIEVLPKSVAEDFGICSMRRARGEDSWYDIALSRRTCIELRRLRRSVLLTPIFRHDGVTHRLVARFEETLEGLKS
jgi:hypothetical protein